MQRLVNEMRRVHRTIDDYTEKWVAEPQRDEQQWNKTVEAFIHLSDLPESTYDSLRREAEGKKLWLMLRRGELSEDDFAEKSKRAQDYYNRDLPGYKPFYPKT